MAAVARILTGCGLSWASARTSTRSRMPPTRTSRIATPWTTTNPMTRMTSWMTTRIWTISAIRLTNTRAAEQHRTGTGGDFTDDPGGYLAPGQHAQRAVGIGGVHHCRHADAHVEDPLHLLRSEERRVGKEGRSR